MDNLVLIRVVDDLGRSLSRAVLSGIRAVGPQGYRLRFEKGDRSYSLVVSLRPELPWLARPVIRRRERRSATRSDRFAGVCKRALAGMVVEKIEKPTFDRIVFIRFAGGASLVAELATHRANLVLVDPAGRVVGTAKKPRSSRHRIAAGGVYSPPSLPARLVVPSSVGPEGIDACLAAALAEGESLFEALRRRLFGVGSAAAELVAAESAATGESPGTVLSRRLEALAAGGLDPVIEADADPAKLAREGEFDPDRVRLWPWPAGTPSPRGGFETDLDAAGTAGLYHEALEMALETRDRLAGLRTVLDREVRRLWETRTRIEGDLRDFEDPERYRLWGEALLAGLRSARRAGGHVAVPDPYQPERDLLIPAPPGMPLPEVAESCFRKHRRAKRGRIAARERIERLLERGRRLERLRVEFESVTGAIDADRLEEAMRGEGIPVGLVKPGRDVGGPGRGDRVSVEGVRIFTSTDGHTILVGRTGRANDRLTFKVAAPEDFWLHVLGRPGAHVVIRNPMREARISPACLHEAAGLAAWYSGLRGDDPVDVQWTRRKNVRRLRGAPPGTVLVKRFETVRVRPSRPEEGS